LGSCRGGLRGPVPTAAKGHRVSEQSIFTWKKGRRLRHSCRRPTGSRPKSRTYRTANTHWCLTLMCAVWDRVNMEMSLQVLAYNLQLVIAILSVQLMMQTIQPGAASFALFNLIPTE
jgi:hypothetical protein